MGQADKKWLAMDEYIVDKFAIRDSALDAALADADKAGLPQISVSPPQGKMLMLLAKAQGARRILEIGTLAGYSTIWLSRALPPDGRLITLEYEPKHADVARTNIARAGFAKQVEVRVGRGLDSLKKLVDEKAAPFDFIFIDADKTGYADYLEWTLKLSRPGTVIIADNVVRDGAVCDGASKDENVQGIRKFNDKLAAEKRVIATAIQTVGSKGYDGFSLALVK